MPVQRFAPMSKEFATFDCDAHVTEPPLIWERAHEFLTRDELDALKQTIWWDAESRLLIAKGIEKFILLFQQHKKRIRNRLKNVPHFVP